MCVCVCVCVTSEGVTCVFWARLQDALGEKNTTFEAIKEVSETTNWTVILPVLGFNPINALRSSP